MSYEHQLLAQKTKTWKTEKNWEYATSHQKGFFLADNSGIPASSFVAIFRTNSTFLPCIPSLRKMELSFVI
jgi:hypothetical protein